MPKMFTFKFEFINPNKNNEIDEITFCAETKTEAKNIFNDWYKYDEKNKDKAKIENITVIYNQYDANEYGNNYGQPYEYKKP